MLKTHDLKTIALFASAAGAGAASIAASIAAVRKLTAKKVSLSLDDFEEVGPEPTTVPADREQDADSSGSLGDGELLDPPLPPASPATRKRDGAAVDNAGDGALYYRDYTPVCFCCGKPMTAWETFRDHGEDERCGCSVDRGLELLTVGGHGSEYWSGDLIGSRLSVVICDGCLEGHADRLHVRVPAEPDDPWPKPTTMREYDEESSKLLARWLDDEGYELGGPVDMRPVDRALDVLDDETNDCGQSRGQEAGRDDESAPLIVHRDGADVDNAVAAGSDGADRPGRSDGDDARDARLRFADERDYSMLAAYGLRRGDPVPDDLLLPGGSLWTANPSGLDPERDRFESTVKFYSDALIRKNREARFLQREVEALRSKIDELERRASGGGDEE